MKTIFAIALAGVTVTLAYALSDGTWTSMEMQQWHPAFSVFFTAVMITYVVIFAPTVVRRLRQRGR